MPLSHQESYSYDAAGRVTQLSKVVGSQTFSIGYQYDAGGDVTEITYPSGRAVYQAYNNIGQLCQISPYSSGCGGSSFWAGNFSYNGPGQLGGFTYGNGIAAQLGYWAPRGELTSLRYTSGAQTYLSLNYWYSENTQNCPNGAAQNNGSIQCITDGVDGGRSINFGYDALGRMVSAQTNGDSNYPQWGMSESYDRYGNRLSQSVTAGSGPSSNLSFTGRNQPVGYSYDASGNMTVEPLIPQQNYMTYDAENRMTAVSGSSGASYGYDGNGLRVVKSVQGGATTVSIYSGSSVIAEYDNGAAPTAPSREYIYNPAGGATTGLLAMISSSGTAYYHQDHESVRMITDANGNVLTQEGTYPFGEPWYQYGNTNKWVFTSYNRDSETGLDYALARYYDSRTGTFCSADPLAGSPGDPQSWNRYPYGRNDPISITDPSGQSWWSSLLIDIGVGVAAAFLPEIAPSLFADAGSSSAIWGSTTVSTLGTSSTTFFATSTLSTSIGLGVTAGGMAAMATNPPQMPQMPPTPQARFIHCNQQYGTPKSKQFLNFKGYQDALEAANSAKIQPNNLLSLWDNENADQETFPKVGPYGEVGPMQITTSGQNELFSLKQMPSGWNTNAEANLLAGARLFAHILQHHAVSSAAAIYNGGTGGMNSTAAQGYQKTFNANSASFQKLINCMH